MGGPAVGVVLELIAERVVDRRRAAEDVPLDVAAGGQGREQGLVDPPDRRRQVVLEHAVELELLPGRDPQGAVADRPGQLVAGQVLVGRELPAHDPDPDHELVGLLLLLALELRAEVAVVLLVRPVELEDRRRVLAEVRLGRCSISSATNVLRYSLAILIASTLLGFGPGPDDVDSIGSYPSSIQYPRPGLRLIAPTAKITILLNLVKIIYSRERVVEDQPPYAKMTRVE